jgi:hypothetical protein
MKLRTHRLDLLTAKEAAEYLQHSDLAILPIGCLEEHGPLMPLGCDVFMDSAATKLLAERWNCVVLPPIPYTYPGASGPWPGSLDIGPEASIAYIKAVANAALKMGFKRLVISGMHGPLSFMVPVVIRAIFQESGQVVAYIDTYEMFLKALKEEFGWSGEDMLLLASMRVLGIDEHFPLETEQTIERESPFPETLPALSALGVKVPYLYTKSSQHSGIHARLKREDAGRMAVCMKRAVEKMDAVPELFAKYQAALTAFSANPSWKSPDVWSV